jgi:hypothetical protein
MQELLVDFIARRPARHERKRVNDRACAPNSSVSSGSV